MRCASRIPIGWTLILVTFLTLSHRVAFADGLVYEGPIIVDAINGQIQIGDTVEVRLDMILTNTSDLEQSLEILHPNTEAELHTEDGTLVNPVVFKPFEVKRIYVTFPAQVYGDTTKNFSFIPNLLLEGKYSPERVKRFAFFVVLPEGVHRIVGASKPFSSIVDNELGQTIVFYEFFDLYPTSFQIMWSELDVQLGFEKRASPLEITQRDQIITVEVTISNQGEETASNLVLIDDFLPAEFEAVEPEEEFTLTDSPDSDPHLFWEKAIDALQPGEAQTVMYQIRYIGDVSQPFFFALKPGMVKVDGDLVAVSNPVEMSIVVGQEMPSEVEPDFLTAFPPLVIVLFVIGALLGVGLIATGLILAIKRRA